MSAAAALPYTEQSSPGKGASIFLALAVHALLLAFLFYGIRWQTQKPAAIEIELVVAAPEPLQVETPPPPPEPLPEPKPVAKVEAEPPPPPPKPEIAIKAKEKPKPVKPAPVPPKPRYDPSKKWLEEEIKQVTERKNTDAAALELEQRKAAQAATARSKAIADYMAKIRGKIKGNIVLPIDIKGNPEAIFAVVQLPSGEILSVNLKKPSGHAGYDAAVERAILKSSPLPRPGQGDLFARELELKFRPQEE
ncbi:MAG: energy transducer TonB [Proteobacteria bacterium]|nr:energy transducer TonB [Pseudomonadota bacterium]